MADKTMGAWLCVDDGLWHALMLTDIHLDPADPMRWAAKCEATVCGVAIPPMSVATAHAITCLPCLLDGVDDSLGERKPAGVLVGADRVGVPS